MRFSRRAPHIQDPDVICRFTSPAASRSGWSGDKFAVVLSSIDNGEDARLIAQRIIDALADTGMISGFEALLRWQHEGRLVTPAEFDRRAVEFPPPARLRCEAGFYFARPSPVAECTQALLEDRALQQREPTHGHPALLGTRQRGPSRAA